MISLIWCFAFFAVGIGVGSFFARSKESAEEISGDGMLYDKIVEKENKTKENCNELEKKSFHNREQVLEKAKKKAVETAQKAEQEVEQLQKSSEKSIRDAFKNMALAVQDLIMEKVNVLAAGENKSVKKGLKLISEEVVSVEKTITWKSNSFELIPAKGGISLKAEDVASLTLSLLDPGMRKKLPTTAEITEVLQKKRTPEITKEP